jgi:hypothetical protein
LRKLDLKSDKKVFEKGNLIRQKNSQKKGNFIFEFMLKTQEVDNINLFIQFTLLSNKLECLSQPFTAQGPGERIN